MPTVTSGLGQISVAWTAVAGADEYEVYYGTTSVPITLATTTAATLATITGLTNGTTYHVRLRAKNANGISDYGPSSSILLNEHLSPGLYQGNQRIGDQNLSAALTYIAANAVDGDNYLIAIGADETIAPATLNYSGRTVGITLQGFDSERKISLSSNGRMFDIRDNVTLTLDENITLMGRDSNNNSLLLVNWYGGLIMNAGASITKNTSTNQQGGGGVHVSSFGTFIMYGGTISENTARTAGGVFNEGTFTMYGGTISGNTAEDRNDTSKGYGGGVVNRGATFTMYGGTIIGNTAERNGGGVMEHYGNGTFTMYDGAINRNTAGGSGGGVYIDGVGNFFTMYGGTISGNTASSSGGGVGMRQNSNPYTIFTMHGGTISGNTAGASGGGVSSVTSAWNTLGILRKQPSDGEQTSGIIYGSDVDGVDEHGVLLRNTATNNTGHAVSRSGTLPSTQRNTTAGPTDHIDSTTDMGLSVNGEPPFEQ